MVGEGAWWVTARAVAHHVIRVNHSAWTSMPVSQVANVFMYCQ